jgi:hypothetical protein
MANAGDSNVKNESFIRYSEYATLMEMVEALHHCSGQTMSAAKIAKFLNDTSNKGKSLAQIHHDTTQLGFDEAQLMFFHCFGGIFVTGRMWRILREKDSLIIDTTEMNLYCLAINLSLLIQMSSNYIGSYHLAAV